MTAPVMTNGPRIAGVIGSPVGHSLSPTIHQAAFDSVGVDWVYTAFEVPAGQGPSALDAMRVLRLGGLSVTMPHKSDIAAAVDRLDPAARVLQSVNTVSWIDGELVGSSTDGAGFVASLVRSGIDVSGARIAIIGAGGAARSLVDALGRTDVADVTVLNRTRDRAEQAASMSPKASVGIVSDVTRADIVVNATSVGMGIDPDVATETDLPCDPSLFREGQVITDLIYHPLQTAWMRAATDRGITTIDGLGMLVEQAVLQQQLWLGDQARPDAVAMRAAAIDELLRRDAHG